MIEATRLVLNQEPPRLSSINSSLRGDLETIVRTAMEKDRERRYQSARGLANDIDAYLQHDPISARPPSLTYQLKTFARKHRPFFLGLTAVFLVLSVGILLTTAAMLNARSARDEAQRLKLLADDNLTGAIAAKNVLADTLRIKELALIETQRARNDAESRHADALQAEAEAKGVTDFLVQLLSAADPRRHGKDVTVRELLDIATTNLNAASFQDQQLIRARLHHVIGTTYLSLGEYIKAEPHLITAGAILHRQLAENNPFTLSVQSDLARIHFRLGKDAEAEALFKRLVERLRPQEGTTPSNGQGPPPYVKMSWAIAEFLSNYIVPAAIKGLPYVMIEDQVGRENAEVLLAERRRLRPFTRLLYRVVTTGSKIHGLLNRWIYSRSHLLQDFFDELMHQVGFAFIQSWRDPFTRRPFALPSDLTDWKLEPGVTKAFERRLQRWREHMFILLALSLFTLIGGSVIVAAGVVGALLFQGRDVFEVSLFFSLPAFFGSVLLMRVIVKRTSMNRPALKDPIRLVREPGAVRAP